MDLQTLTNSRLGMELVLKLGRLLPNSLGIQLARWIGGWYANQRDQAMVRAVRANHWVISGETALAEQLDRSTRATFIHSGRCIYDYYHTIDQPKVLLEKVEFSPEAQRLLWTFKDESKGVMLVGPHMSNFDVVMRVMALRGLNLQLLTYPDPPKSYQVQNLLREEIGLETTPFSAQSMRQATQRLQAGGMVLTGLDRPVDDLKYRPRFFGKPSTVTVAYVRLALRAKVPVVVLGNQMRADGSYYVQCSEPIWMQPKVDLEAEVVQNAEVVLTWASEFIRRAVEQWLMFYPVWPEALTVTPGNGDKAG